MLAYKVTEENTPLIKANNDGIPVEIESDETYFITATPDDHNRVVTAAEFEEKYLIQMPINAELDRYIVRRK